ncbi:MAG: IS3 family transposase [Bacteroidales bacterium]|nr:IS3 family transposase [Bacteroidales bacterium]
MEHLYQISGISRQGFYKAQLKSYQHQQMWRRMLEMVFEIRKDYPRMSARKMHYMLGISEVGINGFERFVSIQGLSVQKHRSVLRTTHKGMVIYPNLTHGLQINGINQLWVSDITYYLTSSTTYYLVFILDVYSQRIIGQSASDNMFAVNNVQALEMALRLRGYNKFEKLIHHSDKGSQYGSTEYTGILKKENIKISMAGNCLENPYAERINGIIKNDYLIRKEITSLNDLKREVVTAVDLYNNCSNGSLGMLSPIDFELAVNQIPTCEHPGLQLYDFNKTREENSILGFRRHKAMKINSNKKAVALNDKTTAGYSPGSDYSLESCPPAELSSASSDYSKLKALNEKMKLIYKQLK